MKWTALYPIIIKKIDNLVFFYFMKWTINLVIRISSLKVNIWKFKVWTSHITIFLPT